MNSSTTRQAATRHPWSHFMNTTFALGITALLCISFLNGCKDEIAGVQNVCAVPTVVRTSPENGVTGVSLSKIGTNARTVGNIIGSRIKTATKTSGATGVAAVKIITATFSARMDPNTITAATFSVKEGANVLAGTVSYTDTTATFVVQNGLSPNLVYTCTLSSGITDLAGTRLAANYIWSFTTTVAGVPIQVSPVDGAVNQSTSPMLVWNTVPGANTYRLQVSTSNTFATTILNDSTLTNSSHALSGLTAGTTYFWRVNSKVAGGTSAYSTVWSFTTITAGTPVPLSPIDGAVDQSTSPTLIWGGVSGANSYHLQVSLDPGFVVTVFNDSTLTSTSKIVSGLTVGTTYFWRVNAKISGGTSAYSAAWSFTTIAVPSAPTLIDPANAAVNIATSPTMRWNSSAGAATYRLQVSTVNNFASVVFDSSTQNTSKIVIGLAGGTVYFWRVSATNAAGTSAYSTRSFTTITAGTPTLVAPVDGAVNQPVNSTMVWNSVPGAGTYRLQVSTSNTFATTLFNDSTLTNTSQLISGLNVGTTYFWRVNSKIAGQTSAYSNVWSFTTIAQPTTPTLVAPLNAAIDLSVNPTMTWNDVPGADTYRLQVSLSNTFASTVYNDSTLTGTSQQVTGLTVGTTYFWRVNAKNIAGTSAYSAIRSFTTIVVPAAPVLFAPADLATNQSVNPNLIWNAVSGAETYRLQVSTSNTFATTFYNDSTRTSTSQQISGLAIGTVYFWRVNAKNAAGTGAYSVIRSFTTIVLPAAPILVAPLDAAVNQSTNPTLLWNAVPGAETYRVQVSTSNTFATTLYNDSTRTSTSQLISGLSVGTTYFWRVNTKNSAGTSAFSTIWSFNTTAAPLAPILVAPINLATNQPTNPSLSWNASAGAVTYRLQLSTSNTFATTVFNDSTITGTSQPITGLINGTTYFWRVNAKNISGTSPYSIVRSFTVILAVPQPPILSAPLDQAIDQKLSLSLSWNSSVGATSYRLQLDTSQAFANPSVNDSTIIGLVKSVSALKTNTTYYWRVNAKNSGGTSAYSTVWRFTTGDGLAPGAVPLKSVSTFGIMATATITNTGNSVVDGDMSLDPGTSITGFTFSVSPGPGVMTAGHTVHIKDGVSAQARIDLLAAYDFAKTKPAGITITGGADLGGLNPSGLGVGIFGPGTYTSGSTMLVSTPLILDGGGNADAVWVFQIGSSMTANANVTLTGNAQEKNVFWVPTADATIGIAVEFHGTIVTGADATAKTGAVIYGRILSGAITGGTIALDNTTVNVPLP